MTIPTLAGGMVMLAILAGGFAWLFSWAMTRSQRSTPAIARGASPTFAAAIVGGIVAGVLLGPTVLGRLAPEWYEREIIGGYEERVALHVHQVARKALGAPMTDAEQAHDAEATARLEADRWHTSAPWRITTLGAACLFLLLASLSRDQATHETSTRGSGSLDAGVQPAETPRSADWYASLSIGLWSAALPASMSLLILRWLDIALPQALGASACVAVGALILHSGDRTAAEGAEAGGEKLLRHAARVAVVAAIALATWALMIAPARPGLEGPFIARSGLVWMALAATLVSALAPPWLTGRWLARTLFALVAVLSACIAARLELVAHFSLWPLLALAFLSGDGRWLGALTGALLANARRAMRAMTLVLPVMSAATTQVALAAILLAGGIVTEPLAYGLLAGALVMEMSVRARADLARRVSSETPGDA